MDYFLYDIVPRHVKLLLLKLIFGFTLELKIKNEKYLKPRKISKISKYTQKISKRNDTSCYITGQYGRV